MASGFAVVLAAILSVGAVAQPIEDPSPEQIEQARVRADRIIASAEHPAGLANVTDSASATVLHRASRLKCTFPDTETPALSNDAGDTFALCSHSSPNVESLSMALRLGTEATPAQLRQAAEGMVRRAYPNAAFERDLSLTNVPSVGDGFGRQFKVTKAGADLSVAVVGVQKDGWVYFSVVAGAYAGRDLVHTLAGIRLVSITEDLSR